MRVVFRQCIFRHSHCNRPRMIQETFRYLREWSACMGMNPADLIEVGVPRSEDGRLTAYTCALEYPLPAIDEDAEVSLGELPGGRYAVLRVEKDPAHIEKAVLQLKTAHMPGHGLVQDPYRPVYEIFQGHELDYCVPLLGK